MIVAVVQVREVRVAVDHRRVPVHVHVRFARRSAGSVCMLVVLVVLMDMLMPPSPMKRRRKPGNGVPDFVTWPFTRISRLRNSTDVVSPSRTSTCFDIMLINRPKPAVAIRFT